MTGFARFAVPARVTSSATKTEAFTSVSRDGAVVMPIVMFLLICLFGPISAAYASESGEAGSSRSAPIKAKLTVRPVGIKGGKAMVTQTVRIIGSLRPFRNGQRVRVWFYRDGKQLQSRSVRVGRSGMNSGRFTSAIEMKKGSRYGVQAIYYGMGGTEPVSSATTSRKSWRVGYRGIRQGGCGPLVRAFRRALNRLAMVPGQGRCLRGRASRAVLAYRKVSGLSRNFRASRRVVRRVFNGKGRYRVRRPGLGNHVEAPLGRQVLVFAKGKRPYAIFPVSTGKPSTPTIRGTYRFYRKDPGYNAIGMYYSSYFIRGYAIHGYQSVPNYPASAGCLRTFIADQPRIYSLTRIGQPIHVFGRGR